MSRLSSGHGSGTGLHGMISYISTMIRESGTSFATPELTKGILSLESLTDLEFDSVQRRSMELTRELDRAFHTFMGSEDSHKLGLESIKLTPSQLEAGTIAAMAYGDPVSYAMKAAANIDAGTGGGNVRVSDAPMDYTLTPALEAFNETELKQYMAFSIVFNVMAARQGEFSECFYPTIVVSPDMPGADVTVRRTMVLNEIQHQLSGTPTDFNRQNLIDAVINPTILANESNSIIPVVVSGPVGNPQINTQYFVNPADVAPYILSTDAGQVVLTAPLIVGQEMDLLGLSQRTDIQIQGQYDMTDFLDPRIMLGKIYLKLTTTGGTPVTSIIPFDVSRSPRNQWVKSPEGNYKEYMLDFRTTTLALLGTTEDTANTAGGAPALVALRTGAQANWLVRVGVRLGGYANVEFGTISVNPGQITFEKIYTIDTFGNQTDITTAIYSGVQTNQQWLASQFALATIIGFDVIATRSNLNRRTRGLLMETTDYTERYTVALTPPVTMPSPVGSTRDSSDMTTLINAVRIRNDNLAVTTLLSYRSALSTLISAPGFTVPVPDIEGMGRYLVRPFYESITLDVLNSMNNIMTKDRMGDVQQTIVNAIRDIAYRMYQQSGYQPALDAMTGGSGERPVVIVGTDSVTAKYLQIDGDTRTLGLALDSRVVISLDERMWGQIAITITRANQNGADPLCFGQMFWMPELASTVQVTRNGATVKETMVQPRMRHVNNLPILAWITVTNLDSAITDKASVYTHVV